MALKLVRRGRRLYAQGTLAGKRIRKSTGYTVGERDLAEVERIYIEARALAGKTREFKVEWLVQQYLEQVRPGSTDEHYLLRFQREFGRWGAQELEPFAIYKRVSERGVAAGTMTREINAILACLNWCKRMFKGSVPEGFSIPKPRVDDTRDRFLSEEEVERFLAHCPAWFLPTAMFLFYTGARLGEMEAVTWNDVLPAEGDEPERVVLVTRKGKGKRRMRTVPLHPRLRSVLTTTEGHVLRAKRGGPWRGRKLLYRTWREVAERAGLGDLRPHDARRTFATILIRKGVDATTIRELLGHQSEQMLRRYAYLGPKQRKAAVMTLPMGAGMAAPAEMDR